MRNDNLKSGAFLYLQMILLWIFASMLLLFLRNYGVDQEPAENLIKGVSPKQFLPVSIALGAMAGIVYTTIELIFELPYFQRHSYGRILLGKLLLFFFSVKVILAFAIMAATFFTDTVMAREEVIHILRSETYWVIFIFYLLVAGLTSFVRLVSQKFGPKVLWNMFIGKYRNPREEMRVFMFLDLKSSTTIAEKLGHIKFSRLIQYCFADLTPAINKHKVEIYQYVGDEAVLSWTMEAGFKNNNCIHCYFTYMEVLNAKSDYYQKEYGIQPVFKASPFWFNMVPFVPKHQ
jgi:adenylate cyclase